MSTTYRKKLIEVALPLGVINEEGARRKRKAPKGFPTSIHTWWAQRPLAAARAVLFGQLVDDPGEWEEFFPSDELKEAERQRLFRIIEELVPWEAGNDERIINAARLEIARSWARAHKVEASRRILSGVASVEEVNRYLLNEVPPIADPFAGGGTIPLEAQRLGLRVRATDLNPVAILINKALIEFPPRFSAQAPVSRAVGDEQREWRGAEGLAADLLRYGQWMREAAWRQIGEFYPPISAAPDKGQLSNTNGEELEVVAWLWARTVPSPNPAVGGVEVPLLSSYWLSTKEGNNTWLEPIIADDGRTYEFVVRTGVPKDKPSVDSGTKQGRGANFRCLLTRAPIEPQYIRECAKRGRLGQRLVAVVAEQKRRRIYLPASPSQEKAALAAVPSFEADAPFVQNSRHMTPWLYGLDTFGALFTRRQLLALGTFTSLLASAHKQVAADASSAGVKDTRSYSDAVTLYLAFAISRMADYGSTLSTWRPKDNAMRSSLPRQALAMTWDFAEGNPFGKSSSGFLAAVDVVAACLESPAVVRLPCMPAEVEIRDAATESPKEPGENVLLSTDPPYYDNVPYADLSDFFYVWLRRGLQPLFPSLMGTILVPKDAELVADSFRHGDRADQVFIDGMTRALGIFARKLPEGEVAVIYYAFRQSEIEDGATASTGWQTFLESILASGLAITGTVPLRTEGDNRQRAVEANALASSIVLVCRRRSSDATTITRADLRRKLRSELPGALKVLQQSNIAPVDVAQASIGPGMAIFSTHKLVLEADGSAMTVRSALQLINEVLDEYLSSGEGDFDPDTRFAITWYEQFGWEPGPFGDAETLAKARNVSVRGVEEAGVCKSAANKVRILKRSEMRPLDYDPAADERPTVWEFTQHMIRNLEDDGEEAAARLLKKLGSAADATRELAYRLYNTCERKKWAEDARSYNGLILAWTELEKLAARMGGEAPPVSPSKPVGGKKKGAKTTKAPKKGQQTLFEGDE